jgi:hypothetical protein
MNPLGNAFFRVDAGLFGFRQNPKAPCGKRQNCVSRCAKKKGESGR